MKWRRSGRGGYTIVEALIFLAVSSAIAVSAMAVISGQQRKAEFQEAVRSFEGELQDVANDVSAGYASFPSANTCWFDGAGGLHTNGAPGVQRRCIFVGRALRMAPDGAYSLYTLVGFQRNGSNQEVQNLTEATPQIFTPATEARQLGGGLRVAYIRCTSCISAPGGNIGAFGFLSNFGTYSTGSLESGSGNTNLAPIVPSTLGVGAPAVGAAALGAQLNPASGLLICLNGAGNEQRAEMRIGGQGGQLRVRTDIKQGACT